MDTANVEYAGPEAGKDSERADCDTDGILVGAGRVDDGTLRVTVLDGAGNAVFTKTYQDDIEVDGENLSGADGTWIVQAEREAAPGLVPGTDAFEGEYSFTLTC